MEYFSYKDENHARAYVNIKNMVEKIAKNLPGIAHNNLQQPEFEMDHWLHITVLQVICSSAGGHTPVKNPEMGGFDL